MNSSNDKRVLHLLSVFIFLTLTVALILVSVGAALHPTVYSIVVSIALALLNIGILCTWMGAGLGGGLAFLLLAAFLVFLTSWGQSPRFTLLFLGSFAATSVVGYVLRREFDNQERSHALKAEKIEEEMNLLVDGIRKKRLDIDVLRRKIERYATLKEVAEALSSTLSLEEVADLVIDSAMRIVGKADRAFLFLVDEEAQELALHASRSKMRIQKIKEKKGDVFDNWALKQRKPLLIEDPDRDFRFSQDDVSMAKKSFRSLIAVPLVMESKVIGVLRLDATLEFTYTQDDLRLLDIVADLAAVAVENNHLYRKTEELAIKDGLTDLVVHRYFKERLEGETKRAARTKSTFSLLILDIDYFKDYNDKYGHISGDIVLRYLAGILKNMAKEGDIVARYGGEEFALVLIGRDKKVGMEEAETIRRKIECEPLVLRREKTNLTVSIGVANFPSDTIIAEDLIKKADTRLYKAKKEGRNRVSG